MKKLIFTSLYVLFAVSAVNATTYGPIPNYKGYQTGVPSDVVIPTTGAWYINNSLTGGYYKIGAWGGGTYTIRHPAPIFVDSFVTMSSPADAAVTLTEIVAYDTQQNLDPNEIPIQRGFTVTDPEILAAGNAFFKGTHAEDPCRAASVTTSAIGALAGMGFAIPMTGDPAGLVYIVQATVPKAEFLASLEFTCQYNGYTLSGDPNWPYQHTWTMNITQWDPSVAKVTDVEYAAPFITPGYIKIVPPANWSGTGNTYGRYGFKANSGHEITVAGGSYNWTVKAKIPNVAGGYFYLTQNGSMVTNVFSTLIPAPDPNSCGAKNFLYADFNTDCHVNFIDFALFAQEWLACTDPKDPLCADKSFVGIGIAFNGDDVTNPARVAARIGNNIDGIDPNDLIVEFQGQKIASGAALQSAIGSVPPLTAGEPVHVKVLKPDSLEPVSIVSIAGRIPLDTGCANSQGKRCVEQTTADGKKTCGCITGGSSWSHCTVWEAQIADRWTSPTGTNVFRMECVDSNSNSYHHCYGDWYIIQ